MSANTAHRNTERRLSLVRVYLMEVTALGEKKLRLRLFVLDFIALNRLCDSRGLNTLSLGRRGSWPPDSGAL